MVWSTVGRIINNYHLGTHPDDHMYDIHLHKEQNFFLFWVSVADYKVMVILQLPCVRYKAVITTNVVLANQWLVLWLSICFICMALAIYVIDIAGQW